MRTELEAACASIEAQVANHVSNMEKDLKAFEQKYKEEQEVAQRAAAMGDRSENAEWQIANDNLARYSVSIMSLRNTIETYEQYKASYAPTGLVMLGSTVKVRDMKHGATLVIKLYPPGLGNAKISAITIATPLGKAILGKAAGETVIVKAPLGDIPYYIEEVL